MCNKFETTGLLYVSGELTADETLEYEAHLAACAECSDEVGSYRKLREEVYTVDNLSEEVSPKVDAKIMSACAASKKTRPPVAFLVPMMFIKKYAPVPIFLMLVMVAIGGYVQYHTMNANNLRANAAAAESEKSPAVADAEINTNIEPVEILDDSDRVRERHLGDLSLPGVVPVSTEE